MRVVVADTSPLHYLVLIEAIDLLPRLFEIVHVPEEVRAELLNAGAPPLVRTWAAAMPAWVAVHAVPEIEVNALPSSLDDGERAAIALADTIRPDLMLIDERAGTAAAETRGFAVTGTLGVLTRAARRDMIDLTAAFTALKLTNFHTRQVLLDRLLAEDRTRREES